MSAHDSPELVAEQDLTPDQKATENQLANSNQAPKQFSIFGSFFWLFCMTIGAQTLAMFFIGIGLAILGFEQQSIIAMETQPYVLITFGLLSSAMALPMINNAAYYRGKWLPFDFLALKPINKIILVKLLLAGIVYSVLQESVSLYLDIAMPQFMLDVKAQVNSPLSALALVIDICLIAPIIEEFIFRGVIYERLRTSRVGNYGAIFITSLTFTLIHLQYEWVILAMLFPWALLLGFVRYKTGNLYYCIALHILNNIIAMVYLFSL